MTLRPEFGAIDGFNPRPSQPEGATTGVTFTFTGVVVSIHAPPNRKERRPQRWPCPELPAFQSTPLPTGRSDVRASLSDSSSVVSIHAPPNRKERHPASR